MWLKSILSYSAYANVSPVYIYNNIIIVQGDSDHAGTQIWRCAEDMRVEWWNLQLRQPFLSAGVSGPPTPPPSPNLSRWTT